MALTAVTDGFDSYTSLVQKWAGITGVSTGIQTSGGRTGANFLHSSVARRQFAAGSEHATIIFGVAIKANGGTAVARVALLADALATTHITINVTLLGTVEVRRGTTSGTLLGTSASYFSGTDWLYLEGKIVLGDSTAGSVELRLGGNPTPILNLTGIDTKNAGTATVLSAIELGSTGPSYCDFDDLYVETGADAAFWGDTEIVSRLVNGAGSVTQLTPVGSGTNWQNVDEVPPSATDYNQGTTDGLYDLYTVEDLTNTSGTIKDLTITDYALKTGTEVKYIRTALLTNATLNQGASQAVTTALAPYMTRYRLNPVTGIAWTRAEINALEIGGIVKDL